MLDGSKCMHPDEPERKLAFQNAASNAAHPPVKDLPLETRVKIAEDILGVEHGGFILGYN